MNNLNKYDRKEKYYRRLRRESKEINKLMRSTPWTTVDKPYQDGWFITLELRDDAKRREDAPILQQVLGLVMHKTYTKSAKLVNRIRNCKKLSDAENLFLDVRTPNRHQTFNEHLQKERPNKEWAWSTRPYLGVITRKKYDSLTADVKKWFHEYKDWDLKYYYHHKEPYKSHLPHYLLQMRVRPAMVTHESMPDPVLQKRDKELDKLLEPYWRLMSNGCGSRSKWEHYYGNRAHRVAQRAAIAKFMKTEVEDFEITRKIRNYD